MDRLVLDTSVLLNFLKIERLDLLTGLRSELHIVEEVKAEIVYAAQAILLLESLEKGEVRVHQMSDIALIRSAVYLRDTLGLGLGEAFSFAAAHALQAVLALDDERAIKRGKERFPDVKIIKTPDLIINAIRQKLLDVVEADAIKENWATHHRYILNFKSFSERISDE